MRGVMVIKTVDCCSICLFMWAMKWSQQQSVLLCEQPRFKRVSAFLKRSCNKRFPHQWNESLTTASTEATGESNESCTWIQKKKKQQPETAILSCACAAPGRLYQRICYISAHTDGLHLRYRWDAYRKAEWDKPRLAWLWRQQIMWSLWKQVVWPRRGKLITSIQWVIKYIHVAQSIANLDATWSPLRSWWLRPFFW